MKKYLVVAAVTGLSAIFIFWGYVGHQTVARIAENHLTPQAKAAIHNLLGNETIVDVASWADEVVSQPDYKNTAAWHYVNVEPGLNYQAFADAVKNQRIPNVYTALQSCEQVLNSKNTGVLQKANALKFIVHLVGDAHQPMHVSRAEDRGGNSIQMQFNGKGTNLHALWDSGLIGHESLSFAQKAAEYDTATPQQIKRWQNDDIIIWLFESYQISMQLYTEAEKNNNADETYYTSHISILQHRIERAGIRLAGVLNELFKNNPVGINAGKAEVRVDKPVADARQAISIAVTDAAKHYGDKVTVTARVYGSKDFGSMVLVNAGAPYPDSPLTVVLRGEAKAMATGIDGKKITVTGIIIKFKEKPEIEVINNRQITVDN